MIAAIALLLLGCDESSPGSRAIDGEAPQSRTVDTEVIDSGVIGSRGAWYADITAESGLDFVHEAGPVSGYFLPQIVGSGGALLDVDNDGRLDVYLLQNAGPQTAATNRLYRQNADGRFVDVTEGSGLGLAGYGMGVAVADVDNDGDVDVFITEYGDIHLMLNRGDGTFVELGGEAGLRSALWGTSSCFFDYDRDGWLDIAVANYLLYDPTRWCADETGRRDYCGPSGFPGAVTRLFRNVSGEDRGSQQPVRFEDVTLESGLADVPGPGLGIFCADFDDDGWADIFVADDGRPNRLWINRRDRTFAEEAIVRGIAVNQMGRSEADMGVAIGDVDGDAAFDVLITHLTKETHTLFVQGPAGLFQDRTAWSGLASPRWRGTGFGVALLDMDHDGALDLAVVNGKVKREGTIDEAAAPSSEEATGFWRDYVQRNQIFANDGDGRFTDVSNENPPFSGSWAVSRALLVGDVDNDGALDLLVTRIGQRVALYGNVAQKQGRWLMIDAVDPALNRAAYGAKVTVRAGKQSWVRWLNPAHGYLSSHDPRLHFGLGETESVDAVEVRWPDGARELFTDVQAQRLTTVRKGTGQLLSP